MRSSFVCVCVLVALSLICSRGCRPQGREAKKLCEMNARGSRSIQMRKACCQIECDTNINSSNAPRSAVFPSHRHECPDVKVRHGGKRCACYSTYVTPLALLPASLRSVGRPSPPSPSLPSWAKGWLGRTHQVRVHATDGSLTDTRG